IYFVYKLGNSFIFLPLLGNSVRWKLIILSCSKLRFLKLLASHYHIPFLTISLNGRDVVIIVKFLLHPGCGISITYRKYLMLFATGIIQQYSPGSVSISNIANIVFGFGNPYFFQPGNHFIPGMQFLK